MNGMAHSYEIVDFAPLQALAVGGQLALFGGFAPPAGKIATAGLPDEPLLPPFLGAPFLIVMLGIGRSPLSLHLALQPMDGLLRGCEFLTEHLQVCFALARHTGDGGGAEIQAERVRAYRMLGLAVGHPFQG